MTVDVSRDFPRPVAFHHARLVRACGSALPW